MPVCVFFQKVGTLLLYYTLFTVFENHRKSREVSHIYFLSGQKLIKNDENGSQFDEFLTTWS